jgi:hypothetical protein
MMNSEQWKDFPVGTYVRCTEPEALYSDVARKLKDRVGIVTSVQMWSGKPIIAFPKIGRRREYTWVATHVGIIERVDGLV